MAKASNPVTFGEAFEADSSRLAKLGVLDVTLALDTKLFVDPLLIQTSQHKELATKGATDYRRHFEQIIRLLKASKRQGDPAWRAAQRLLQFHEVHGTCLGYGATSIHGSGLGRTLSARLIHVASEIVAIGIEDPDLFVAMAFLESDIGPDRISDMTTNILLNALADFNQRILRSLRLTGSAFRIHGEPYSFMVNPYEAKPTPVILVPTDILRDLPIAHDWDSVSTAAAHNEGLRDRVNTHIAEIWAKKTKRDKKKLKSQALSSREAFQALLDAMHQAPAQAYDTDADPEGLVVWATRGQKFAKENPVLLVKPRKVSLDELMRVVMTIVDQFRHLVENCGLNKELYRTDGNPRHEGTVQRLFFAAAYTYCKANNVDVSPEIDTGNGKIDFKFSSGFAARVLVEVKLSTNSNLVTGFTAQLEDYKASQETTRAVYLVIDVGKMGKKDDRLVAVRNDVQKGGALASELEFVDGTIKASPSKRRK